MEALVTIIEVGAYSERQYQKQDGTPEYFKSRGVVMKAKRMKLTPENYLDFLDALKADVMKEISIEFVKKGKGIRATYQIK